MDFYGIDYRMYGTGYVVSMGLPMGFYGISYWFLPDLHLMGLAIGSNGEGNGIKSDW